MPSDSLVGNSGSCLVPGPSNPQTPLQLAFSYTIQTIIILCNYQESWSTLFWKAHLKMSALVLISICEASSLHWRPLQSFVRGQVHPSSLSSSPLFHHMKLMEETMSFNATAMLPGFPEPSTTAVRLLCGRATGHHITFWSRIKVATKWSFKNQSSGVMHCLHHDAKGYKFEYRK